MKEKEYYSNLANWDFSQIKYSEEKITNWDFYEKLRENTNDKSLCLDLGTAAGEKLLKFYPEVGYVIGTDYSEEMIENANNNLEKSKRKRVGFVVMDNLKMNFPNETFDLISARHTIINAKQIYDCLKKGGTLVVQGVDQKDCWDLKELFGRGQAFKDKEAISDRDYRAVISAGFEKIERFEILENEYYETKEDLMALLLKTPILEDFSEIEKNQEIKKEPIEQDLLDEYVKSNKTEKGIVLHRKLYGIIAKK